MSMRLDYPAINAPAIKSMLAAKSHMGTIAKGLRAVIELRVSQINGCRYCIRLHRDEALAAGEADARLAALATWRDNPLFDAAEQAALAWAETVTKITERGAPDPVYNALQKHFSAEQIVDLTLIIAQMNAWNRLAISFETP
ncbi:carboxymuconolactone decarboxylase family protein [Gymnodinialimonas sp. 2305UL16-5]|uniref:carboxymuconolactone decarboxylase family protein n=1 Tax=Gymnodinialimonas mytili TaxID=3126503 RepID=UPI0030A42EAB